MPTADPVGHETPWRARAARVTAGRARPMQRGSPVLPGLAGHPFLPAGRTAPEDPLSPALAADAAQHSLRRPGIRGETSRPGTRVRQGVARGVTAPCAGSAQAIAGFLDRSPYRLVADPFAGDVEPAGGQVHLHPGHA